MPAHNYTIYSYTYEVDPISGVQRLRMNSPSPVYPTHSINQVYCEKNTGQPNGTGIEVSSIARIFLNTTWFNNLKSLLQSGAVVGISYSSPHSPPTISGFSFG
jgi:hypothetical protein